MTKRALIVVVILLALAGLYGERGVLRPYGIKDQPSQGNEIAKLESGPAAAAENPPRPLIKLCSSSTGTIDDGAFHSLRDRLAAGVSRRDPRPVGMDGPDSLPRIDAAVVQAEHDCLSAQYDIDNGLVAYLMQLVASNWWQQGNLARADQLYQEAYGILRGAGDGDLDKMALLRDWANFKLASGEPQRAEELAQLRTAEARKLYGNDQSSDEISKYFASGLLVDALKFQAEVFEKIGLAGNARAAEQEAERLSAQQKPCQGLCGETIQKIK